MKSQRIRATGDKATQLLEECAMLGYDAEIDGDEIVVYYGQQPKKNKKAKTGDKTEKWSKRERNYGYTRG